MGLPYAAVRKFKLPKYLKNGSTGDHLRASPTSCQHENAYRSRCATVGAFLTLLPSLHVSEADDAASPFTPDPYEVAMNHPQTSPPIASAADVPRRRRTARIGLAAAVAVGLIAGVGITAPTAAFAATDNIGQLDSSFTPLPSKGLDGKGNSAPEVVELTVGANAGKYLEGGWLRGIDPTGTSQYLARFNSDGTLDTSFSFPPLNGAVRSIVELQDGVNAGKYLIGGDFTFDSGDGPTTGNLARLNTDGTIDQSFQIPEFDRGQVQNGLNGSNASLFSVAVVSAQAGQEKYLVGGNFVKANGVDRTGVARFNADGSLDTSFTPPTLVSQYPPTVSPYIRSAFELKNGTDAGKYLIGGSFDLVGSSPKMSGLIRLNPDGSLDSTFSNQNLDGWVTHVKELTVGSNAGSYLAVGGIKKYGGATVSNGTVRINPDGSRDTTFNLTGNNWTMPWDIIELTEGSHRGEYVLGGQFQRSNPYALDNIGVLGRYHVDGSVDPSFDLGVFHDGANVQTLLESKVGSDAGKYVVAGPLYFNGTSSDPDFKPNYAVVRLSGTEDGSSAATDPDPTQSAESQEPPAAPSVLNSTPMVEPESPQAPDPVVQASQQFGKCAGLPKKIKKRGTTVVKKRDCRTDTGQKISYKISKSKNVKIVRSGSKISLITNGKYAHIRIIRSAAATADCPALRVIKTYTIK